MLAARCRFAPKRAVKLAPREHRDFGDIESHHEFKTAPPTMPLTATNLSQEKETVSPDRRIREMITRAAHLLPAQGPIEVFVHHNTLHAFEHLPFHTAVRQGWELYGAEPYLSESRFRELLSAGRITREDIDAVLADDAESQEAGV